jgi:hypothetical protein
MNAIFTGRKRSGKTTLAFDMAMRRGGGIIIFDPKREWRGWPATTNSVAAIPEFIKQGDEVIIFHPDGDKREAIAPLIDLVMELHKFAMAMDWDKTDEHFTLIVDEAVNVSTAQFVDKKLLALVAENRPEILDIYLTFQSPKDANNLLKSRFDTWFIFNTSLPSDLEYLHKEVGVPDAELIEIQHLRPHEYAHFYFDGGAPKVEFNYEPDEWFRPLEFFEMNLQEREEFEMARGREGRDDRRNEDGWLWNIVDKFWNEICDLIEGEGYEITKAEGRSGHRERQRERARPLHGYERE